MAGERTVEQARALKEIAYPLPMEPRMKRVLFVCVENSNRSQMAEAFARIHGAGRVEAASAGSKPSGRVNPKAVEAMKELGYDLTTRASKGLDEFNGQNVEVAVTMGCGDECPLVLFTLDRLPLHTPISARSSASIRSSRA